MERERFFADKDFNEIVRTMIVGESLFLHPLSEADAILLHGGGK
jgi:hypothetical protein